MGDSASERRDRRERVVRTYVASVTGKALSGIRKVFARDATLEDPAGSEPIQGLDEILTFYEDISFRNVASLELSGPIRMTRSSAAFPLRAVLKAGGGSAHVDVIEVFDFDENDRVVSMKTYWG